MSPPPQAAAAAATMAAQVPPCRMVPLQASRKARQPIQATRLSRGALAFTATTSSAAVPAAANESVQIRCLTAPPNGQPVPWSALPVSSSTLTLDGTSLLLSLAGIGCNASELTVSLLCAPMIDGGATTDAASLDSGADH